jgi:hypothetical protein
MWLALQGLGNLVSYETFQGGYTSRIQNAAVPLILVGIAIALYEFLAGYRPEAEWSLSEDGDLTWTLRRKKE